MNKLDIGPLTVAFHRTVRVAEEKLSNLPPSLGNLPIYQKDENYFLALHDKELPMLPKSVEEYIDGIWYGLRDEDMEDITGASIFAGLKNFSN
jgi:hypothetical protein